MCSVYLISWRVQVLISLEISLHLTQIVKKNEQHNKIICIFHVIRAFFHNTRPIAILLSQFQLVGASTDHGVCVSYNIFHSSFQFDNMLNRVFSYVTKFLY